jgi:hypothetical protein
MKKYRTLHPDSIEDETLFEKKLKDLRKVKLVTYVTLED